MRAEKNAVPGVTAPGNGTGSGCMTASDNPRIDFSTFPGLRQARIAAQLGQGKSAAMTARELAALLHAGSEREISMEIERERSAGLPICASNDSGCPGYYLPADAAELAEYRRSLERRVAAVSRTLHAIEDAHDGITGQQRFNMEAIE